MAVYVTRSRIYATATGRLCEESDPEVHHLVYPAGVAVLVDDQAAADLAAYEDGATVSEPERVPDPAMNTITFGTTVPAPNRPKRKKG